VKLIDINRKFYSIPETWNELSGKQLLQVMDVFYNNDYSAEKAELKLLKILTGMSWWQFFRAPVTTTDKICFFPLQFSFSWSTLLFRMNQTCYGLDEYLYLTYFLILSNELTKQVLPEYKEFYGPADDCGNMKMNEFVFSEHYYMAWAAIKRRKEEDPAPTEEEEKEAEKLLNNLVAVLYRPARKKYDYRRNVEGDCRIAFNENLCEYFATSQVYAWPLQVKMAIVHYYEACRQKWVNDNMDVFGGDGEPAKYGLLSVMRGVAKSGVHGTFDNVEQKYVSMILIELNEEVAEAREMEKAMKK
jgi:hypothetical protein